MDNAPAPQGQPRRRRLTLEGGYETELVEKPAAGIAVECPVCKLILRDPHYTVTCSCGKNFCKTCIEPIRDQGGPCPHCNTKFDTIAPNIEKKLYLENSKVYCSYRKRGCDWKGDLKDLDGHLKSDTRASCRYVEIACALCTEKVPRGLMGHHREAICLKRQFLCQSCNNYQSDYEDVTKNHMPTCDRGLMDCPNEGCVSKPMPKEDIQVHLLECPETVVQCKLAPAGCDIRFQRKEADKHYQESIVSHVEMLIDRDVSDHQAFSNHVKSLETENIQMKKDIKTLMEAVDFLRSEYSRLQNEDNNTIKELKNEVDVLKDEVKTLSQHLSVKEASNAQLTRRMDDMRDELNSIQSTVRKNVRLIQQVSTQAVSQHGGGALHMGDMQREVQQLCGPLRCQVDQNAQDIQAVAEDASRSARRVSERLTTLEDEVVRASAKTRYDFERVDMRFEEVEDQTAITLSSQLSKQPIVVTLRDYAKWQVENKEWTSPPFYLAGYKLCLTAFVNGDPNQNAEDFFSLYVHLMRGENDRSLNWPFLHSVVLEILHLTDEKKNVKQVLPFTKDMDLKYNGRVKGPDKRAKGWGYAKFMPHAMLNNFLRGPREFLDIRVSLK